MGPSAAQYRSLQLKLFGWSVLVCTAIVLTMSVSELLQRIDGEKTLIEHEFSSFKKGASRTVREAVWQYDWDMVQVVVDSQTSQKLSYVKICDTKVAKCLEHGRLNYTPFLDITIPIIYENNTGMQAVTIGSIYLQAHYEPFLVHMRNDLPWLFLTNGVSVSVVALVLSLLFHKQVVRRLIVLEAYTRKIDLKDLGEIRPPSGAKTGAKPDEIDLLTDAVGGLVMRINKEFERRKRLEQRLNQAQKMEALGTLAGGIAHDFNNILAAILGFAELSVLKSEPGSAIRKNQENIISAGNRARNLISQVLVFSRSGDQPNEVLVLAKIVEEAITLVKGSLSAGINIDTELDRTVKVKGDATRLHQVVMNIVTNGAQAIGGAGGRIEIQLSARRIESGEAGRLVISPGPFACLKISDNGPGIPAAILPRVFEPFFTTKQAGKGTGMGLAVVHGIVKSHGGTIVLDSEVGRGASFLIYLPQAEGEAAQETIEATALRGNEQRVVIVDDERAILEAGKEIVASLGYRVIAFSSPDEALQHMATGAEADIVITDMTMPEMSGIDFAVACKRLRPDLPVLLWTGHRDEVAQDGLNRKIIDRIVQKPIDRNGLSRAISELIDCQ